VKRAGSGRKGGKGGGPPRGEKRRPSRKGRHARERAKTGAPQRGRAAGRSRSERPDASREGIVREAGTPGIEGQAIVAEDLDGSRWQVECLGEPVEVGARILFAPIGREASRRGEMVRLVAASRTEWVCTLRRARDGLSLTPFGGLEAPELTLAEKDAKKAEDGTRVVVVPIQDKRSSGRAPKRPLRGRRSDRKLPVRVVEVLGPPFDPESDHRALVWKHRLAYRTSRRARLEAEALDDSLEAPGANRRVDLRRLPFITIDPASARDHDDAVYAERRGPSPVALVEDEGKAAPSDAPSRPGFAWTLWVAIADVSAFVRTDGWIDAEARRRGNSFYFPDRSIPMLPERLSSDLCSLRPDVDRLAMVVELRIDAKGRAVDALFHEAIIRSRARLSYEEAAERLASERGSSGADSRSAGEWSDSLRCLDEVTAALSDERMRAGAVALELPEVAITTDDEGRAVDARLRSRNRAHMLIEEAMLAANRAVARVLDRAGHETIHRVHPPPAPTRLAAFGALLERLALGEGRDLGEPGAIAAVLDEVRGTRLEERVHGAALRSMSQARYEVESRGHYALQFEHYLHFTSPIRRYADLEVHRALKDFVRGVGAPRTEGRETRAEDGGAAARLAIWLSGRERVATEVERDAESLASCAIMTNRDGEAFDASVQAATEFGLFVRLDSPAVSGLVPLRTLEGSWRHDPGEEVLVAERSGRRIAQGDRLVVTLLSVDADRLRIAFRMSSMKTRETPGD